MKSILIILGIIIGIIVLLAIISINKRRPKFNNKGFNLLEKTLLSELYEMFDSEIQIKLKSQIEYFEPKRKWRQYWEKSMSMELYGNNENPISDNLKYNRKDESKLATIRFKVNSEKYHIEFDNYDGRIWGWKIRPNPKSIMKETTINVTSKKINNDPNSFAQTAFKKEKIKSIPKFDGLLGELNTVKSINQVFHPIGKQFLENYTKNINSKLPDEYLKIIEKSEGVDFGGFRILGVSEIYSTGLDDGNYYHLTEFDDGVITVKEEDKSGRIYYCHYSGFLDDLGTDFRKIIMERAKSTTPQQGV
ncbi:hypothetical protein [Aquimarina algiphila]|uniref:hypothetical protein n=1 Tax=Aquimarina algiphila TaxID=2047982 RepID=UPI002330F55B|nr:hypothetical protein [Aquimarina algiphila]